MKRALVLAARLVGVTVVLFTCYAVAGALVKLPESGEAGAQAGDAAARLLVVCFLTAAVLTYIILRSRWAGWKLAVTMFLVYYGVATFMGQIESAVFITQLPPGALPRLFLMGALVAAPFTALAVLVLGKRKASPADVGSNTRLRMPAREWMWKLSIIAVVYVILYFTFGYFIAWRHPDVRAYYNGVDTGSFATHMATVARDTPWLIPFQVLRAMLWTALALPVIRMMKGRHLETAIAVGLLLSVVMNAQLLLPNPYMPDAVRMAHLLETASSNFLFGTLVGWLMGDPSPRHRDNRRTSMAAFPRS